MTGAFPRTCVPPLLEPNFHFRQGMESAGEPVLCGSSRSAIARERAARARAGLKECRFCAHECAVDRLSGVRGLCGAGAHSRIFCAQIDAGDEPELVPTFAIAFSGCDLRCEFCVTRTESWNPQAGWSVSAADIARRAERALGRGARTVMLLGGEPTIHLPDVLDVVAALPDRATLVYKTNAHCSGGARSLLNGLFDTWLPDYKFGNDRCAESLAGIRGYTKVLRENLLWARRQSRLIVRHVLMPGHVDCCWLPIAEWLAAELPETEVSLREAFWPRTDAAHLELRRGNSSAERRRASAIARNLGLNLVP